MKKTGLFKIIMFTLLAIVVITWIVPASYFNSGELAELGKYRIGFFDFFQLIFGAFEFKYFIQIFIFLLSVGALYGVLAKTGKYRAWIEKIASKFRGKEYVFLIIAAVIIVGLTSAFNYGLLLFMFFPLIISIVLAMGYDKITAFLTTFGAMLIGTIGSTISYNITGVINEQLSITKLSVGIWYRIAILVLSLAVLIVYLVKAKHTVVKKAEKKAEKISTVSNNPKNEINKKKKANKAKPQPQAIKKSPKQENKTIKFKASALSAKINQGDEEVVYCLHYLGLQGEQKNMTVASGFYAMETGINKTRHDVIVAEAQKYFENASADDIKNREDICGKYITPKDVKKQNQIIRSINKSIGI